MYSCTGEAVTISLNEICIYIYIYSCREQSWWIGRSWYSLFLSALHPSLSELMDSSFSKVWSSITLICITESKNQGTRWCGGAPQGSWSLIPGPAQDTSPGVTLCAREHRPNASGALSGSVLSPLPRGACSGAQTPSGGTTSNLSLPFSWHPA